MMLSAIRIEVFDCQLNDFTSSYDRTERVSFISLKIPFLMAINVSLLSSTLT